MDLLFSFFNPYVNCNTFTNDYIYPSFLTCSVSLTENKMILEMRIYRKMIFENKILLFWYYERKNMKNVEKNVHFYFAKCKCSL